MRKYFSGLCLSAAIAGSTILGCQNRNVQENAPVKVAKKNIEESSTNPVDKYALIVVGSSDGEKGSSLEDPVDKNCFWLSGVSAYKYLMELGFRHENIYLLYDDGNPDFSEEKFRETIRYIKEHEFTEPKEMHKATERNLERLINEISRKVDGNDIFVFALDTHGAPSFVEMEGSELYYHELERLLRRVRPGIGVACVGACSSGAYINKMKLDDYVLISSTDEKNTWGDRNYSFNSYFFQNLTDSESDSDKDGKISVREAFLAAREESRAYWKKMLPWFKKHYKGLDRLSLDSITINPQMNVGKYASAEKILKVLNDPNKK